MTPAKYMLDTDSVSYALRGQGNVATHILDHRPSELCVSSITVAELRFGAERRKSKRLHQLIDAFVGGVTPVAFDADAASQFGRVAALLSSRGAPIDGFDALIAGHALSLKLVLVTNNVRHFARVPQLQCETWA